MRRPAREIRTTYRVGNVSRFAQSSIARRSSSGRFELLRFTGRVDRRPSRPSLYISGPEPASRAAFVPMWVQAVTSVEHGANRGGSEIVPKAGNRSTQASAGRLPYGHRVATATEQWP